MDTPGIGNTEFKVILDKDWFSNPQGIYIKDVNRLRTPGLLEEAIEAYKHLESTLVELKEKLDI